MKILVTGAGGLLGRAVKRQCAASGEDVSAFDHQALDISDQVSIASALERTRPDVVINCAAWTDVDGCQLDPSRAQRENAGGPEVLASSCRKIDALLITISTDYVFDGSKSGFYTQRDQPNPLSVYGQTKLEGERRAQTAWARTIVVRSGYIFGEGGSNFLSTIISRALRGETLNGIHDMFGTPTYAPDLARRLHRLAQLDLPGTYHVVNDGAGVSFEGFARAAFKLAGIDESHLKSVSLATLNRPAPRPLNSRLRCLLSEAIGLEKLPDWHESLKDFVTAQLSHTDATAV